MKRANKLLLVEDDVNMGFLLKEFLINSGFLVELAKDGDSGLAMFNKTKFDFCIIDIMLPGIDGFTLMERIRKESPEIPVIFLTARSMKQDVIKGFDLGVDDYITKPFDEDELLCRIHAILNRYKKQGTQGLNNKGKNYYIGKYQFDTKNQALIFDHKTDRLTYRENEVLEMLCANKNNIVKRSDLLIEFWGRDDYFHGRSLDVFITRLRKKLSFDPSIKIENIPTVGYILHDEAVTI